MIRKIKLFPFLIGLTFLFMSCEKNKFEKEMELLDAYLLENNITVAPTASGIYYIETLKGTGPEANGGDEVEVKYTGSFIDGEQFETGTYTFHLGYGMVIPGWDEGINYMNEGGKAILIIPSNRAYGEVDRGSIPAYSTLIFEVELLNIL